MRSHRVGFTCLFENSMNDIKKAFNLDGFIKHFSQPSGFFCLKQFLLHKFVKTITKQLKTMKRFFETKLASRMEEFSLFAVN